MLSAKWCALAATYAFSLITVTSCAETRRSDDPKPVPVSIWQVRGGSHRVALSFPATAAPYLETSVVAPADGLLRWNMALERVPGAHVASGTILATVESPLAVLQEERAQLLLLEAREAVMREREAFSLGLIPEESVRLAQRDMKLAESDLKIAQARVLTGRLQFPSDATVIRWSPIPDGTTVQAGTELCTLSKIDRWRAVGYCSTEDWQKVRDFPDWRVVASDGVVSIESTKAQGSPERPATGRIEMEVFFTAPAWFSSGMRLEILAESTTVLPGIAIPSECVTYGNGLPCVFVIDRPGTSNVVGYVRMRRIVIAQEYQGLVTLLSGLSVGETIARNQMDVLAPGMLVTWEDQE